MARKHLNNSQGFEDVSSYSSSKEYKKRKKNRRGRAVLRGIAIFFCMVFILCGSGLVYVSTTFLSGLTTTSIAKDNDALGIDADNIVMDNSIKNIALFGVDSRNGEMLDGNRSDVIMILTVDNRHGKIKMTSILRDSELPIEGEDTNGNYLNYTGKINEAYYYGGPELAIRTLNQNFGLDIRDYVTINFANLAAIVDAFGGVDITMTAEEVSALNDNLWSLSQEIEDQKKVDQANGTYDKQTYAEITYSDYIPSLDGTVQLVYGEYQDGTYHLTGNAAVAYGRIRYVGNDYARVERQQTVLVALLDKLEGMGLSDYTSLIRELLPYCSTSLDLNDILSMTPILFSSFTISSISVPNAEYENQFDGQDSYGYYHMIYDPTLAAKRISAFIYETDSPYWEEYGDTSQEPDPTHSVDE